MKTLLAVSLVALAGASLAHAQVHAHCPMAPANTPRAGVDHRHDDATGTSHALTEHHFTLAKDGGSIRLEVKDAAETEARGRVREHLRLIADSFAAGDFSLPMQIHDQLPPGASTMKERKAAIRYAYSPTDKGGVVAIATRDAAALAAVHQFLRFQIRDHATGDPTE
jgi:hypothetical protein